MTTAPEAPKVLDLIDAQYSVCALIDVCRSAFDNDTTAVPLERRGIDRTLHVLSGLAAEVLENLEHVKPGVTAPKTAPDGDTEIMRLFRLHRALLTAARGHVSQKTGDDLDAELEELFYRHADKIENEIMALPCVSAADFAAKAIIDTKGGDLVSEWKTGAIWREARALVGDAISEGEPA